ncbi:HTH-type transcriptional regulator YesS [Frankliniella fusca]|uniref:HTH-type transcriptional regulator YesS n=1 Tax=Frankliniella fusca TaxID=407009 RepID=A0AAE1HT74_9NEOP|nr:HTH-type transcriptional regulator YesS [Frankliniella fusca]
MTEVNFWVGQKKGTYFEFFRSFKNIHILVKILSSAYKSDVVLAIITFLETYRNTPSTVTGMTPAELMFAFKPRTQLNSLNPRNSNLAKVNVPTYSVGERVKYRSKKGDKVYEGTIEKVVGKPPTIFNQLNRCTPIIAEGDEQIPNRSTDPDYKALYEQLLHLQFKKSPDNYVKPTEQALVNEENIPQAIMKLRRSKNARHTRTAERGKKTAKDRDVTGRVRRGHDADLRPARICVNDKQNGVGLIGPMIDMNTLPRTHSLGPGTQRRRLRVAVTLTSGALRAHALDVPVQGRPPNVSTSQSLDAADTWMGVGVEDPKDLTVQGGRDDHSRPPEQTR